MIFILFSATEHHDVGSGGIGAVSLHDLGDLYLDTSQYNYNFMIGLSCTSAG